MVKPMVISQQNALIQGASSMFGTGSAENENKTLNVNPEAVLGTFSSLQSAAGAPADAEISPHITAISDLSILQESILTTPKLVLYLWSSASEEGKEANSQISEIAEKFSTDEITFMSVNTQQVVEVAYNFDIKSIPWTYIYSNAEVILKQEKFDQEEIETTLSSFPKE